MTVALASMDISDGRRASARIHSSGSIASRCRTLVRRPRRHRELLILAQTISRREGEIVAAVLTTSPTPRSEGLNRVAKLEAHRAYGLRNPVNQRRRIRIAYTRTGRHRAKSHTVTTPRSPAVITRDHDPG